MAGISSTKDLLPDYKMTTDWVNTREMGLRDCSYSSCVGWSVLWFSRQSKLLLHRVWATLVTHRIIDDDLAKSGRGSLTVIRHIKSELTQRGKIWWALTWSSSTKGKKFSRFLIYGNHMPWYALQNCKLLRIFSLHSAVIKRQNCSKILHFCFCLSNSMSHRNWAELPSWAARPLKCKRLQKLTKNVSCGFHVPACRRGSWLIPGLFFFFF